ncbi:hypothetical protein B296_00057255 [Ensete ventricosum]|uniref:Uncharacterized protein n=1 Tax=Ensete ventricosum TaxID=4639 RepID=A0A426X1W7_ENSVE|nr:hypothetical protein B296_00057255 [Ensete ventricosum]
MTEQTCRANQPTVPLIAAASSMAEPTRRADQPIVPLTVGDWRHGRADATGRRANNAPDSGRLAACHKEGPCRKIVHPVSSPIGQPRSQSQSRAVGSPSGTNRHGVVRTDSRHILEAAHRPRAHPSSSHLVPNDSNRGLFRSSPSSTSLNRGDTDYHLSHSPVGLDDSPTIAEPLRPPINQGGPREHLESIRLGPPMQDPLETRSKAPSIIP